MVALGLVPPALIVWIMWFAPVGDLGADRTAMALRDFTALWAAGRAAAEHAFPVLSDPARFTAYLRDLFGTGMPAQIWPYPPPILLLARPLSMLSLPVSYVVYTVAGGAALAASLGRENFSPAMIAAILLSPAMTANALVGQNGAIVAALLTGGLLLLDRRPILAGLLLGLLCAKPQFALLVPIFLLAGRYHRTLLASCVSAVSLALFSLTAFGYEPWVEFFTRNTGTLTDYVGVSWQAQPAQTLFSSIFMAARSLGAGVTAAYLIQGAGTCLCAYTVWRLWSEREAPPSRRVAATIPLVLLAAPWVHTYDMPALAVSIVLLSTNAPSAQAGGRRALLGFAWLWPGLSALTIASPMISVLTVAAVAGVALRREPSLQPA